MELFNSFYDLTDKMISGFDAIYTEMFTKTISESLGESLAEVITDQNIIDFIVGFFEFYGMGNWNWATFLFGGGLVTVLIWKFVSWIIDILP